MYEYSGRIIKIVDGDTLNVELDLGLDIKINTILRIIGVNAPEMKTDEGKAAREFVVQWLDARADKTLVITTHKDRKEKYGRYLASVGFSENSDDLATALLVSGHAVQYYPK